MANTAYFEMHIHGEENKLKKISEEIKKDEFFQRATGEKVFFKKGFKKGLYLVVLGTGDWNFEVSFQEITDASKKTIKEVAEENNLTFEVLLCEPGNGVLEFETVHPDGSIDEEHQSTSDLLDDAIEDETLKNDRAAYDGVDSLGTNFTEFAEDPLEVLQFEQNHFTR